jgi:hypothetical protein
MSTSWDNIGTISRFDCGGELGEGLWVPNTFVGTSLTIAPNNVYPTLPIGTADFSIEFWAKMVLFTAYNTDIQTLIAVTSNTDWAGWTTWAIIYVRAGTMLLEITDGSFMVQSAIVNVSPGWHHFVFEVQRGAVDTMKLFVDGVQVSSTSIVTVTGSIGTAGTARFTPYATDVTPIDIDVDVDPGTGFPDALTDPFTDFNFYHQPAIVGPEAVHLGANAILTAAQRQDSISRRDVQDLSGTAILYRWAEIREVAGWERNPRHMMRAYSDFTPRPGTPKGIQGQVLIPDLSGNSRNFIPQVFADSENESLLVPAYGQEVRTIPPAAGQRSPMAFASDPFFQTGGGIPGGA